MFGSAMLTLADASTLDPTGRFSEHGAEPLGRTPRPAPGPKVNELLHNKLRDLLRLIADQRDSAAFGALFRHFAPQIKGLGLKQGLGPHYTTVID
jgi:hypothetical protein